MSEHTTSLEAFEAAAERFARTLTPKTTGATLVTLSGDLGAGKTQFTKIVAQTLGVTAIVTSPTFVIEKIYPLPEGGAFAQLVHIDAYRLTSGVELAPLELDRLGTDAKTLIMLEWPEQVRDAGLVPDYAIRIEGSGTERTIYYG